MHDNIIFRVADSNGQQFRSAHHNAFDNRLTTVIEWFLFRHAADCTEVQKAVQDTVVFLSRC